MVIHPEMKHGHPSGWNPKAVPEIYAFADSILKDGMPIGRIIRQPGGRNIELKYESEAPIVEAKVYSLNEVLTYRKAKVGAKHSRPGSWDVTAAEVDDKIRRWS